MPKIKTKPAKKEDGVATKIHHNRIVKDLHALNTRLAMRAERYGTVKFHQKNLTPSKGIKTLRGTLDRIILPAHLWSLFSQTPSQG